jgi:heme exporter protein A
VSAALLRARGITRRFGAFTALDGVDLDVPAGGAVAIFGPNGAGKTTLLRILARALKPTSGTVRFEGVDERDDLAVRARIGLLSHHTFLYDDLTARDNLVFFARLHGVTAPEARADALLAEVGLDRRGGDPVRAFSRGMQQRLALARALVHEPELLLLDEPFSGLDPHAGARLRATLRGVRASGRAILMTTHDVGEGLELTDRWIFLSRGRVTAQGVSDGADRAALVDAYREGAR